MSSTLTPAAICSGTPFAYTATSGTPGTTFSWTRAPVTGISNAASSGKSATINETLTNTTTGAINVAYVFTLDAGGCKNTQNVTISVKPKPALSSTLTPAALCSGTPFAYTATGGTPGTTFSWTRAPVTGISNAAASGNSATINETLTNTTVGAINVVYVFTLNAGGCKNTQNVTISVKPKPALSSTPTPAAVCSGAMFAYEPTATVANTGVSWSRAAVQGISEAASGGVGKIGETLTNTTTGSVTVTYLITLQADNCSATRSVTLPVYARPTAGDVAVSDETVNYGAAVNLKASGKIPEASYKWYDSQTATDALYTGATYAISNMKKTTTFYVGVSGKGYCENAPNNRKAVTVTVIALLANTDYATTSCDAMPLVIDNFLTNDTVISNCIPVVSIAAQANNGTATVKNSKEIEYAGSLSGRDSLTYGIRCGTNYSEAKIYITVNAPSSAFVDGLRYSAENSLAVSSPYCKEQNIFYSNRSRLYNSLHEPMKNGGFMGRQPVVDGLAACYMGGNRYLFFSVTDSYDDGTRGLKAYIVDMNADYGKGEITDSVWIENENANMSESIELLAANGIHKYWLIYAYYNGARYELRVRPVDAGVADKNMIAGTVTNRYNTSNASLSTRPGILKSSPQYNRIALANSDNKTVDVFDFDNAAGTLNNLRTAAHPVEGVACGVEFSPGGNQIYATGYTAANSNTPILCQYTVASASLNYVDGIKYPTYTGGAGLDCGGDLKLGPDGRIYLVPAYDARVGTVSNPDSTTALSGRYSTMPLNYKPGSYALRFSTGLTRPSVVECNSNNAPVAYPDDALLCVASEARAVKVNVTVNDTDANTADRIYLTGAEFADASDTTLASITVNAADSTVLLTVKSGAYISPSGHEFVIIYHVKDNGLPASQCAGGTLKITAYPSPNYPDIRAQVCPDANTTVNLAKYIDTTDRVTDIRWSSQIPGISISSPAGFISPDKLPSSGIYTFTYSVTSRCTTAQERIFYLEVLKSGKVHPLKDTIVVCYRHAEAMNINQLFGVDAQGSWSYPAEIENYVSKSTSPVHNGAIVVNGKGVYENVTALSGNYRGSNNVKIMNFTYTTANNSCLKGKAYSVAIVLTNEN